MYYLFVFIVGRSLHCKKIIYFFFSLEIKRFLMYIFQSPWSNFDGFIYVCLNIYIDLRSETYSKPVVFKLESSL